MAHTPQNTIGTNLRRAGIGRRRLASLLTGSDEPQDQAILPTAGQGSCRAVMTDGEVIRQQAAAATEVLRFPDSDGRFLPENPLQARAIVSLRNDLESHFIDLDNLVLEGSMFIYYDPQEIRKSGSPDVFAVLGHDLGDRAVYKLWGEGKRPDFALELVSPSSEARNGEVKKALYARLGVSTPN